LIKSIFGNQFIYEEGAMERIKMRILIIMLLGSVIFSSSGLFAFSTDNLKRSIEVEFGLFIEDGDKRWSVEELRVVYQVLQVLPHSFRSTSSRIIREGESEDGIMGQATIELDEGYAPDLTIFDAGAQSKHDLIETLVHEMCHNFQGANPDITQDWADRFWNGADAFSEPTSKPDQREYINERASINPIEDMAESVAIYFTNPDELREKLPEKYGYIREKIMNGVEFPGNSERDNTNQIAQAPTPTFNWFPIMTVSWLDVFLTGWLNPWSYAFNWAGIFQTYETYTWAGYYSRNASWSVNNVGVDLTVEGDATNPWAGSNTEETSFEEGAGISLEDALGF
jgi:hypothetical protein